MDTARIILRVIEWITKDSNLQIGIWGLQRAKTTNDDQNRKIALEFKIIYWIIEKTKFNKIFNDNCSTIHESHWCPQLDLPLSKSFVHQKVRQLGRYSSSARPESWRTQMDKFPVNQWILMVNYFTYFQSTYRDAICSGNQADENHQTNQKQLHETFHFSSILFCRTWQCGNRKSLMTDLHWQWLLYQKSRDRSQQSIS